MADPVGPPAPEAGEPPEAGAAPEAGEQREGPEAGEAPGSPEASAGEAATSAVPVEESWPAPPAPVAARPAGRFRKRFLVLYLLLGVVLGAAVAGLAVVLAQPGHDDGPAWSTWRPDGDDEAMTQQIAAHVSAGYRLPSGQQLVGIQAAPPRVQDVPIGAIAVRHLPTGADAENPVNVFSTDGVIVYIMCGLGENCAIEEGEPSAERLRLLRREALELALYTFRYVDGAASVVTFLPPRPGDEPSFALLFERGDLGTQLDRPLSATLPNKPPALPENIAPLEVATIDQLTTSNFYRFSFQQLQDGTAVLVLDDPRLPEPATTTESGSGSGTESGGGSTGEGTTGSTGEGTTGSSSEAGSQAQ